MQVDVVCKLVLEKVLKKDKVEYFLSNEAININLETCFEGLPYIEKYKEYISEFEIIRGSMDDVFVNITGRELDD